MPIRARIHVRKGVDSLLHRKMGLSDNAFPVSVDHFDATVSIPIYPAMSADQETRCIDALAQILSGIH